MIDDITVNMITSLISFILGIVATKLVSVLASRKDQRAQLRREYEEVPNYSAKWLLTYYLNASKLSDCHLVEIKDLKIPIPFLTKKEWIRATVDESDIILDEVELKKSRVLINKKIIRKRQKTLAFPMWDGTIFTAAGIVTDEDSQKLQLGTCTYFQYLSACGALEQETYRAVAKSSRKTPIRDHYAMSGSTMAKCGLGAHGLGMQVVIMYEHAGNTKMLLQRRTRTTNPYGGAIAPIPVFACRTHSEQRPIMPGILFHNFLREFGEELFDLELLGPGTKAARPTPDWFYTLDPIKNVLKLKEKGLFVFEILGFGFDALLGEGNIAGLALFKDGSEFEKLLQQMKGSRTEVDEVWGVDIESPSIGEMISNYAVQPGGAFAISLALERYKNHYSTWH